MPRRSMLQPASLGARHARLGTTTFYEVRPGDTLAAVARRFGVEVRSLVSANGLHGSTPLMVGQQLQVNGL